MEKGSQKDLFYMRQAFMMARKGAGTVSPNPLVGAIVVKGDHVVGRGYHRKAGEPHAEVLALEEAGRRTRGATLYVSLEPCSHTGRTPPCVDRILDSGIKRVVAPIKDPHPLVSGRGFTRLMKAGIDVSVGAGREKAEEVNEIYLHFTRTKKPFILLKSALSLDGKIATRKGDSKWITSDRARRMVHRQRFEFDAVMVGIGTILSDDPLLTIRQYHRRKCVKRILLDTRLRIPEQSRILNSFDQGELLIFSSREAPQRKRRLLEGKGAHVFPVRTVRGRISLSRVTEILAGLGITSVLLEAGRELSWNALEEKIVTKVQFIYGTIIIGGMDAYPSVGGKGVEYLRDAFKLKNIKFFRLGNDFVLEGRPVYPSKMQANECLQA
jgi:diaminohydroxyphosphoribosylaminopyrimidine deaminase/5-amino-6-(5-phosphoribosylamino)uracil reductase